jgi:hypothetical protein
VPRLQASKEEPDALHKNARLKSCAADVSGQTAKGRQRRQKLLSSVYGLIHVKSGLNVEGGRRGRSTIQSTPSPFSGRLMRMLLPCDDSCRGSNRICVNYLSKVGPGLDPW